MTEQTIQPDLRRILRCLIVAEVLLVIFAIVAAFFEDRFLPPLLQQYQESLSEAGITATDWLWIIIGVPALGTSILAWVGLWRGWRVGRRLYTIAWLAFLPVIAFSGPVVSTGLVDSFDTILSMVGGAVLSLLYFSDLRLLYVNRSA